MPDPEPLGQYPHKPGRHMVMTIVGRDAAEPYCSNLPPRGFLNPMGLEPRREPLPGQVHLPCWKWTTRLLNRPG